MYLEIDRTDIRTHRFVDSSNTPLKDGEVRLSIENFALTSNNISYALGGDFLDYWGFFPTEAGWGRLPAMGYGIITESKNDAIPVGGRYFGFFPVGKERARCSRRPNKWRLCRHCSLPREARNGLQSF